MDLVAKIAEVIINPLLSLLVSVGVVAFLFGLLTYITAGGSSDRIREGSRYMTFGILGLFIIVAAYGLVAVVQNTVLQLGS